MFVPAARKEFQEKSSWGPRSGAGPGADRGRGLERSGNGAGAGAGRGRGRTGPGKKGVAGHGYCGAPGRNRLASYSAVDHLHSAEGAAPGHTLGTMAQTPAFNKPKVSAGRGLGRDSWSGFWLLVRLEGFGGFHAAG